MLLALQASAGNAAVTQLVAGRAGAMLQRELIDGKVGDPVVGPGAKTYEVAGIESGSRDPGPASGTADDLFHLQPAPERPGRAVVHVYGGSRDYHLRKGKLVRGELRELVHSGGNLLTRPGDALSDKAKVFGASASFVKVEEHDEFIRRMAIDKARAEGKDDSEAAAYWDAAERDITNNACRAFTTSDDRVYYLANRAAESDMIHETLHVLAGPGGNSTIRAALGSQFDEGVIQYFTEQVCELRGVEVTPAYPAATDVVRNLAAGSDEFRQALFQVEFGGGGIGRLYAALVPDESRHEELARTLADAPTNLDATTSLFSRFGQEKKTEALRTRERAAPFAIATLAWVKRAQVPKTQDDDMLKEELTRMSTDFAAEAASIAGDQKSMVARLTGEVVGLSASDVTLFLLGKAPFEVALAPATLRSAVEMFKNETAMAARNQELQTVKASEPVAGVQYDTPKPVRDAYEHGRQAGYITVRDEKVSTKTVERWAVGAVTEFGGQPLDSETSVLEALEADENLCKACEDAWAEQAAREASAAAPSAGGGPPAPPAPKAPPPKAPPKAPLKGAPKG
jgi:hypothetical protein